MTPIASSTCVVVDSSTTNCLYYGPSTSTPPVFSGVVTGGDVLISSLLFVTLTIIMLYITVKSVL